ncbi:MAG: arginine--tRNA ligase [Candidatus Omnitrophica bacterium]|nr:arginine--tRNA ligase [Candidatus Omnitrophota bacterium]
MTAKQKIRDVIKKALADTPYPEKLKEEILVLPAAREEFGDFYTNFAFKMVDSQNPSPQTAALYLKEKILSSAPDFIEKVEVKNGFVNFFLKRGVYLRMLSEISSGKSEIVNPFPAMGKKVLIEFVSSNPTGPLTVAHGRQAAFGESLARILKHAGFEVTKEYYLNDGGRQIKLLGESLRARYFRLKGEECAIPDEGYEGEYLIDIAKEVKDENISFGKFAADYIMAGIKKDLAEFNVNFDRWVKESDFLTGGMVEELLKILEGRGLVYSSEGATWFKSSAYGDEKDRVVIKSDGSYTYLAPDMAYHRDKIDRGYDMLVNIVGPDHHGYIPRIKAIVESFGFNPERLKFIIVQLTTLYRGKEKLSMSTRKGQFVSLRQLMDEVGPDASKFFFIFRKAESHLDFDLELAKKKSVENPVYYLQYAYVRMKHILKFAGENGIDVMNLNPDMALLKEPEELSIARKLAFFPDTVESVVNTFGVHLLAEYLLELAKIFHSYYHKHRVVTENRELTAARIVLVSALLQVFSKALELLNISLPDEM